TKIKSEEEASPIPLWKQTGSGDILQAVLKKEEAARNGLEFLNALQKNLRLQVKQMPSAQPRLEQIGTTGAGKTTLINALLEHENLLPTSHERACTAVAIEVAYNYNTSEDKVFRGEIVFVTRDEFKTELEQLFADFREQDSSNEDDDIEENDLEREIRIAESVDKLKHIYPQINTMEKLKNSSVEELLQDAVVRDIIGTTKEIHGRDKEAFAEILSQYTESNEYYKKTSALWPLVKIVRVFVKSDILKDGIVLVDLPGSMDNNAARSAVAEKYQRELSVACIVSPASRAAQDLLQKYTKRNLQLDGRYDAGMLCFILSQTDREFDYPHYIKQHVNLKDSLKTSHRNLELYLGDLRRQISDIRLYLGDILPVKPGRKRKIPEFQYKSSQEAREHLAQIENLLDATETEQKNEASELLAIQNRIDSNTKAWWFSESRIHKACIDNRNELSALAIKNDYEATLKEIGKESAVPLQVFGVAAATYLKYITNRLYRSKGFPNIQDTQIGSLRDWLISTTLNDRQQYAQAFLDDIEQFLYALKPWIADTLGDALLTADQRALWSSAIEQRVDELIKDFSQLSLKFFNCIEEQIQSELYPKLKQAQVSAGAIARRTAARWTQYMTWSTHRAVNHRHGTWTDSKRREHKWNHDLAHDFTGPFIADWDRILFNQIPTELDKFVIEGDDLIAKFAGTVAFEDFDNVARDGVYLLKEHILRTQRLLRDEIDKEKDQVKAVIRKAHRLAVPSIMDFLAPMYQECAAEGGTGHYKRNRETHQKYMREGTKIHEAGRLAIQNSLDKLISNFDSRLQSRYHAVLKDIQYGINDFFENNSTQGHRISNRRAVSKIKVRLRDDIQPLIDKLEKDWSTELPIAAPKKHCFMEDDEEEEDFQYSDTGSLNGTDWGSDKDFEPCPKLSIC
ncbi:hypothetical protein B7463_g1957, partial [Scytalidium lignicola]